MSTNRAIELSKLYYNQALEMAQVRDLSGAADKLGLSLQLWKNNTEARNLLGLVYYEIGESVAALREWVISQNLQASDNPALGYI